MRKFKKALFLLFAVFTLIWGGLTFFWAESETPEQLAIKSRQYLSEQLSPYIQNNELPNQLEILWDEEKQKVAFEYTILPDLQLKADQLLKSYKPDYASIVAVDASTGKIIALSNYTRSGEGENWAIKSTFPAASIFKVVTAAAALDKYHLEPEQKITFNGGNYTMYRKNVFSDQVNRWTRFVTIKEAFAKSLNTAFARLGLKHLNPVDLQDYASKFYFNRAIASDIPVEVGHATVPENESYKLAEVASGFNKFNTMSPIQGAMIAASIANDGVMQYPFLVNSIKNEKGEIIYSSQPITANQVVTPEAAQKLQELMQATVYQGTSRKSFRSFVKTRKLDDVEVGGKTGSLHGDNPRGKCDWFVGYAKRGETKIAIAAITVNKEKWQVKSAHLAQEVFRDYFLNQ